MDIEGLGKLIENNHADSLRQFDALKEQMEMCRDTCDDKYNVCKQRCDKLCLDVKSHGKTLTQIKTIGSLASLVWGAIVLFASHLVSEMVGK